MVVTVTIQSFPFSEHWYRTVIQRSLLHRCPIIQKYQDTCEPIRKEYFSSLGYKCEYLPSWIFCQTKRDFAQGGASDRQLTSLLHVTARLSAIRVSLSSSPKTRLLATKRSRPFYQACHAMETSVVLRFINIKWPIEVSHFNTQAAVMLSDTDWTVIWPHSGDTCSLNIITVGFNNVEFGQVTIFAFGHLP